jgi:hypothetical protein
MIARRLVAPGEIAPLDAARERSRSCPGGDATRSP